MCVGFSCTLHYWCSFVQGFVCIDCIGCVCEERVYKLCMCLFVCVLSVCICLYVRVSVQLYIYAGGTLLDMAGFSI